MGYSFNDLKNDLGSVTGGVSTLFNPAVALGNKILDYIGEKIIDYLAPDPDFVDRKIPARGPTTPRRVIYGRARVGGQVAFIEASGTDNQFLDVVYVVASHPTEAIIETYIGDTLSTDPKYSGLVELYSNLTGDGVLIPELAANTQLDPSRHKFRGLSYVYARFTYNNEVFQGQPLLSVVIDGKNDIYDPRTLTSGFTRNSALCTRDWLNNYLGATSFDDTTWIEAANDCDTLVAASDGGTEPRFELNGTITLSGSRIESLGKLIANSGVIPTEDQGTWSAVIQKYIAPDVDAAFDENDLLADIQVVSGSNKQDKINTVKGAYIAADQNYEQIEYAALESADYITEDKETLEKTIDYQMVSSPTQCRRLSKITLEKSRFGLTVATKLRYRVWQYGVGARIKLTYDRFGWNERIFRIVSRDIDGLSGVDVTLKEDVPDIYDWQEGDAIGVVVPPAVNLPDPDFVSPPFNFTAVETLFIANTTKAVKARVTFNWETNDLSSTFYELEGSLNGAPYRVFNDYIATETFAIDDLELGDWIFRVRAVNGINTKSAYTELPFTVIGKTAPPAAVTGFVGNIKPFSIELVWDAVPELDIAQYEIRLGMDWDTAELLQRIDALKWEWETRPTGNETILIRAIDTSSNYSVSASVAQIEIQSPSIVEPLSAQVVDNNVLLRWSDATTSFNIDRYEVRRGADFDSGTVIGTVKSTFTSVFEVEAGSYTYWVKAFDVQGNSGPETSVNANVDQPPDFVLQSNQLLDLSTGTKVNLLSEIGVGITADTTIFTADSTAWSADNDSFTTLVGPADLTETWDEHFEKLYSSNVDTADQDTWKADTTLITADSGYPTIKELQDDQGFPFYLQPTPNSASYEQVIDFGGQFALSRIQLIPSIAELAGNPDVTFTIGYSDDNITYVDSVGLEATGINFQYVRVKIDISTPTNIGLLRINSLRLRLDVKLKTDAGSAITDGTGKVTVNFNIPFVDIQSIQVSPNTTTNDVAVYDFVDAPNPTSFDILLFDNTGSPKSGVVSWNVRGV